MPIGLPSIDNQACTSWTEMDRNRFNALPVYFQAKQAERLKTWSVWPKLLGERKWEQNMGDLGKVVQKEYAPTLRAQAFPNALTDAAKKDIIAVRERTTPFSLKHQKFESPIFNFLPNFRDFMKNHVEFTLENINDQVVRFNDMFARTHIFHQSRYLMIPGYTGDGILLAPQGDGNSSGTSGKTNAFLAATLAGIANIGTLSLNAVNLACSHLDDQRMRPFAGSALPSGDSSPLDSMYALVCGADAYNQFMYDPWLLKYKQLDLNLNTKGFKGNLFGRVMCKLEDMPLRIKFDTTKLPGNPDYITFPAPETMELNPSAENYGETIPNPDYVNAELEVAFLVSGGTPYEMIRVGPPPKDFSSMPWNGRVRMTDKINVPCADENGNTYVDTNKYEEYLQLIAHSVVGIVGTQKRGILPILFQRFRGARNPVAA
jgi:hypothetical protein